MKISILLTAYKEEKTIRKAIESILKNKIKHDFELIVLAPDDETLKTASLIAQSNTKIKILKDEGRGKPAALNLGIKKSTGDILILSDGDVYIDEKSLNPMIEKFTDPKVGAVTGHPITLNDRKSLFGYWSHLLTDMADLIRKKSISSRRMIVCSGYLYAFRKKLIEIIPEEALSEDAVISHLIHDQSYKIEYCPESLVFVRYPTNFKDWIKQKKRSAGGYNQLSGYVKNKERMRSFTKESLGIFKVLKYPKTMREFFYTILLILARIYLWLSIFIDINIRKKSLKKLWLRVESTK